MTKAIPTYLVSDHEWMSVKVMAEKDARIAELEAENERLKDRISTVFIGGIIKGLEDENDRLHEALGTCSEKRAELTDRVIGVFEGRRHGEDLYNALFALYFDLKGQNGGGEK